MSQDIGMLYDLARQAELQMLSYYFEEFRYVSDERKNRPKRFSFLFLDLLPCK